MKQELSSHPIRFALKCYWPYRWWAVGTLLAVTVALLTSRVQLWSVKMITDAASSLDSTPEGVSTLWFWTLVFPALYLVAESIWRVSGFCGMRWITGSAAEASKTLFAYLTRHSAHYFNDRFAGAITNKISNASRGVEDITAPFIWNFLPQIIGLVADLYLMFIVHPTLALFLGLWICVYLTINTLLVSRLSSLSFQFAESSSKLKGKMVDSMSNIDTVQYAGEVEYENRYINKYIQGQRKAHLREWLCSEWILVANGVLLALCVFVMLYLTVSFFESSKITVGSIVLVITVVMNLEKNLFFIGERMSRVVKVYGQLREGLEDILHPHEILDPEKPKVLDNTQGALTFKDVQFSYGKKRVFENFSLDIPGGQKVGLIGPSGAGKSTLVSLLLRQFDIQSGSICIDNVNIKHIELEQLRKSIALVPQTTSLFHRKISENILYGRLKATEEEVHLAAKLAEAAEFIEELPNGYDTLVGERGVKLSGGQRQRISIARAILKNAPILVLDEATSSLDSESEQSIQKAFATLMREKTVVAIAHRLSTLRLMDRLVVIQDGRIVEDGTHSDLLKQGGLYAKLWNSQVEGFIGG